MATAQNVDFSNVKEGGSFNRKRIPAGDYLAKVTKIDDAEAKDGIFQYLVSIKIEKLPGSVFPYYCKLQENQLWKLRNLLIAGGLTIPKRRTKVDPNRMVGKLIGVTIEDDEYDGKEQSGIAAVFPATELGEAPEDTDDDDSTEDDDDNEPEEAEVEEAEDESGVDDEEPEASDEYEDMDRTQLKAAIKATDPAFVARKSQTDDDLRAILRTPAADEPEEEPEEEEEEAPAPVARKKKAAATVTDDELEELDIDDL